MSVDIWTIGVLTYELLEGKEPFKESTPLRTYEKMKQMIYPFRQTSDSKVQQFISACLQFDPKKRPTSSELLVHPYLKSCYDEDPDMTNNPFVPNENIRNAKDKIDFGKEEMDQDEEAIFYKSIMIMKSVNPKMKPQIVNDDIFDKDLRCSVRELMDLKFNRTSIMPLELLKTEFSSGRAVNTQNNTHVVKLHHDIADLDSKIVNLKNEIISKVNQMNLSQYDSLNRSNLFE